MFIEIYQVYLLIYLFCWSESAYCPNLTKLFLMTPNTTSYHIQKPLAGHTHACTHTYLGA